MTSTSARRIFFSSANREYTQDLYRALCAAAESANIEIERPDSSWGGEFWSDFVRSSVEKASAVVVDVTDAEPTGMYIVGAAESLRKQIFVIAKSGARVPSDFAGYQTLIYGDATSSELSAGFAALMRAIKATGTAKSAELKPRVKKKNAVFISYCHNDKAFLERLIVHLKPLEKDGLIDYWADTRLRAGDKWKQEIDTALANARVAILLVSADFLASDFIVENELPPLLKNAEAAGTRIIPVIVSPCRFTRDKNLKHFQSINDPKQPLLLLSAGEREVVYDNVCAEVESWGGKG